MEEKVDVRSMIKEFGAQALGGAKVPHGVSNPVFHRTEDGSYSVAVFVYTYNMQERKSGAVKRPSFWMTMDPRTGKVTEQIDCHKKDFSSISLDTMCVLKAEDDTKYSAEYVNQTLAVFNLILKKYLVTGKFDKELNDAYMYMMTKMVSVGFKDIYRDLNNV